MRGLLVLLFLGLTAPLVAQYSAAYSDDDLKAYLRISQAMLEFRDLKAQSAKEKQNQLRISREEMGATLEQLKKIGSWDQLKPSLEPDFAMRFEMLMNYRAGLKNSLKVYLETLLKAQGWNEDYYEHLKLSLEGDPALQKRLLELHKQQ